MSNLVNKKKALAPAIKDYKVENATAVVQKYHIFKHLGYNFFVKEGIEKKIENVSLFLDIDRSINSGQSSIKKFCKIKTQEKIENILSTNEYLYVVSINGERYSFSKYIDYNNEYNTFHYSGEKLLVANEVFFLETVPTNFENLPSDSTLILASLEQYLNYPIYFENNVPFDIKSSYVVFSVKKTKRITEYDLNNEKEYYNEDTLAIILHNFNYSQSLNFATLLYNISNINNNITVVGNLFGFEDKQSIQKSFSLNENIKNATIAIRYVLREKKDVPTKKIESITIKLDYEDKEIDI